MFINKEIQKRGKGLITGAESETPFWVKKELEEGEAVDYRCKPVGRDLVCQKVEELPSPAHFETKKEKVCCKSAGETAKVKLCKMIR